jgi:dihydrofolate reductase
MSTRYIAIAAMDESRGIGKDGVLPWKLPGELKFFKETTMGHPVLFGRTTYQGIGRPLPGRRTLVLSRTLPREEGIEVLRSPSEIDALKLPLIYVCGGTEIYRQFLPRCEVLYLTRVVGTFPADAWFPRFEDDFEFAATEERTEAYRRERWNRRVFA